MSEYLPPNPPITPPPEGDYPEAPNSSSEWTFISQIPLETYRIEEDMLIENPTKLNNGDIVRYISISRINHKEPERGNLVSDIMILLRLGNDDEVLIHHDNFHEGNFKQD